MYARINYVDIKPESFSAVDPIWRDLVAGYEGLVRGFFLRDGDTAHTLSVVVFEDEEKMRVNTERSLSETVKKVAAHRLSEPVLHHLEVCAYIDPPAGGIGAARVMDVSLDPAKMQQVIDGWVDGVKSYGTDLLGGYMCGDRKTGKVKSVTFWKSRAAIEANESGDALKTVTGPYRAMMTAPPSQAAWDLRISVG